MHLDNVAPATSDATGARPVVVALPAHLTPAELAPHLGRSVRSVQRMIARNEFPLGSVIRIGRSKHAKHARILTAKLRAAGWLP